MVIILPGMLAMRNLDDKVYFWQIMLSKLLYWAMK